MSQLIKTLVEIGPLIVFFVGYFTLDDLLPATALFMVATLVALVYAKLKDGRWPIMLLISGVVVLLFGTMTLVLRDETFIKIKPTIVYGIFATILLAGIVQGRYWLKYLFASTFTLPDPAWRNLTFRWILFFIFMAGLNEFVWRSYSTDFWVSFKLFGALPLTFLFAIAQTPFVMRHQSDDEPET